MDFSSVDVQACSTVPLGAPCDSLHAVLTLVIELTHCSRLSWHVKDYGRTELTGQLVSLAKVSHRALGPRSPCGLAHRLCWWEFCSFSEEAVRLGEISRPRAIHGAQDHSPLTTMLDFWRVGSVM